MYSNVESGELVTSSDNYYSAIAGLSFLTPQPEGAEVIYAASDITVAISQTELYVDISDSDSADVVIKRQL